MQAMETERSPGLPSLMVTTRRRLMPQGTSCSFLQAVTQALHSMQRSASHRNFIRAMVVSSRRRNLTEGCLWFLHACHRVEAVGSERIYAFPEHDWVRSSRVLFALVDALEPAREVKWTPGHTLADAFCYQSFHSGPRAAVGSADHPHPGAVLDPAHGRIGRIDLDKHVLLQFGEPPIRPCLLTPAFVFHQAPR